MIVSLCNMEENTIINKQITEESLKEEEKPDISNPSKEEFQTYIDQRPYLVMSPDYSVRLYKSTREISREILVDFSTISRKIKDSLLNDCYCCSKTTGFIYYIRKLDL